MWERCVKKPATCHFERTSTLVSSAQPALPSNLLDAHRNPSGGFEIPPPSPITLTLSVRLARARAGSTGRASLESKPSSDSTDAATLAAGLEGKGSGRGAVVNGSLEACGSQGICVLPADPGSPYHHLQQPGQDAEDVAATSGTPTKSFSTLPSTPQHMLGSMSSPFAGHSAVGSMETIDEGVSGYSVGASIMSASECAPASTDHCTVTDHSMGHGTGSIRLGTRGMMLAVGSTNAISCMGDKAPTLSQPPPIASGE